MKCVSCQYGKITMKSYRCVLHCKIANKSVEPGDDCHCEAKRVKALLEQLPEVKEILEQLLPLAECPSPALGETNCVICKKTVGVQPKTSQFYYGEAEGHDNNCPVKLAQDILEAWE